jgi:cytochrome P450
MTAHDLRSADDSADLDSLDLVAAFEKDMGSDLSDPHPVYTELRARGEVHRGDLLTERLGLASSTVGAYGSGQPYTILGYAAASQVMRDAQAFSNTIYASTVGKTHGRNLLNIDDPDHRAHRSVIHKAFSRKAIERWRVEFIEPEVQRSADRLLAAGRGDLMADFALRYPVAVIHHMLGLPPEKLRTFQNLATGLLLYRTQFAIAQRCSVELAHLLQEYITERRAHPGDDFISVLCHTPMDNGAYLTDEEVVSFLRILLPAGGETTARTIGSLFAYLSADPELLARARTDEALRRAAIEETMRIEPPTQYLYRLCVADTEVDGVTIPAGSPIAVCLASANRDERVYDDPEVFRPGRRAPHLAFGHGVHLCLGMHLARMETMIALEGLLERMPNLRRDPDAEPPRMRGIAFRSPATVPLIWN